MRPTDLPLPLTLLMAPEAYQLNPERPLGRQSAGSGFLEAYLRYGGNQRHHLVVLERSHGEWFHAEACRHGPSPETVLSTIRQWGEAAATTGAIALPGPGLDEWAWKRMPWGDGAFSLVGVVHTLCSRSVQWGLGQFATAPVRPWDALICTSTAAKEVVEGFFERQETWLKERVGAVRFQRPQLPVIPLGVHPEVWSPPGGKAEARSMARKKLGIDPQAVLVLVAGRLDVLTKFHPGPLLRVLNDLRGTELRRLELVIYGEAPNPAMERLWRAGVAEAAPLLPVHWVAGRHLELAGPIRWAADLFVSLPDNPQETFGMTPLEAMASELPCLVSDWDGYRDTVSQDVGVRIQTRMIQGLGEEQSMGLLQESLGYDQAVGQIGQGIAVSTCELRAKLLEMLGNETRLQDLGRCGRKRVEQKYSWQVVIEQWRTAITDLEERRIHGSPTEARLPPWLPDCAKGFERFASKVLRSGAAPKDPDRLAIMKRLKGSFDSWDTSLTQELESWLEKPMQVDLSPRARGWLMKQGLDQFID